MTLYIIRHDSACGSFYVSHFSPTNDFSFTRVRDTAMVFATPELAAEAATSVCLGARKRGQGTMVLAIEMVEHSLTSQNFKAEPDEWDLPTDIDLPYLTQ